MSFALPKNSPYFKFLKDVINKFRENGALNSIHSRWLHRIENCPITPTRPISIEKTFTVFFIISGGAALALTLFMLEIVIGKAQKNKKNNTNPILDELIKHIMEAIEIAHHLEAPVTHLHADKANVLVNLNDVLKYLEFWTKNKA